MSGHSHWAGIKHKKGVADAKRGQLFSKLARNITVAAQLGGGNPEANLRLQYAIAKAKAANMPKDSIERAIKKGTGELGAERYEEIIYEGYGPGGVAIMLEALTDNRNRTAAEIRKLFERHGGNLGEAGCVAWLFEPKGLFLIDTSAIDEEKLFEIAIEAGAEDVQVADGVYEVTCDPPDFKAVADAFEQNEIKMETAELSRLPKSTIELSEDIAPKVLNLMQALEDHDDVQNVYANFELPEGYLEKAEAQ